MYAVIATGGKQYRASVGDMIDVEKLEGEAGGTLTLSQVLLVSDDDGNCTVGQPTVKDAAVECTIVKQDRNPKIVVFKSKKRKGYRRKLGHRQSYTRLKIESIVATTKA
jgi:large subunit ribosomal protein L21